MRMRFLVVLLVMLAVVLTGCDKQTLPAEDYLKDVIGSKLSTTLENGLSDATASISEVASQTSDNLQQPPGIKVLSVTKTDAIDYALYSDGIFTVYNGDFKNGQKYGFIRADGTEITNYIYDYASPFSEGLACVCQNGKYGFIDTDGNTALPLIYDNASYFSEGLAYFEIGDEYGFINKKGDVAFLLDCDSVSSFQEGLAFFSLDGKYGYIDTKGNVVIPAKFDDAGFFTDGLAKVRQGDSFGLIDKTGAFVVSPQYDDISVDGTYFLIKSKGMYGLLDNKGKELIPPMYTYIQPLEGHSAAIVRNGPNTAKVIDFKGNDLTTENYTSLDYVDGDDLVRATADGKTGFLDVRDFSVVIPLIYDHADFFVGDYAVVSLQGKYGVIDRQDRTVIAFQSGYILNFDTGIFEVADTSTHGYHLIDSSGNSINNTLYDDIQPIGEKYLVELNGMYGFLDSKGKVLIPPTYARSFGRVLDSSNCIIASGCIIIVGEPTETTLSGFLLTNEITPRIKPYSVFLKDTAANPASLENPPTYDESIPSSNKGFSHFNKLYDMGGQVPVLYCYARSLGLLCYPAVFSGFYSLKDGQLRILATGLDAGASFGGDHACLWQDSLTHKVFLGMYY